MPVVVKWIVLALVTIVALSPLGEIFDQTDQWSQDGFDLVLYVVSLFCFAGMSMIRRHGVIITGSHPREWWPCPASSYARSNECRGIAVPTNAPSFSPSATCEFRNPQRG